MEGGFALGAAGGLAAPSVRPSYGSISTASSRSRRNRFDDIPEAGCCGGGRLPADADKENAVSGNTKPGKPRQNARAQAQAQSAAKQR